MARNNLSVQHKKAPRVYLKSRWNQAENPNICSWLPGLNVYANKMAVYMHQSR